MILLPNKKSTLVKFHDVDTAKPYFTGSSVGVDKEGRPRLSLFPILCLLVFFLASAPTAYAAISIVDSSKAYDVYGGSTLTITGVNATGASAIAVGVQWYDTSITVSSVTFNGVDMGSAFASSIAENNRLGAIYGMTNPSSGTYNVVITFSGNTYALAGATTVSGSDSTTVFRAGSNVAEAKTGYDSTLSLSVPTSNGDLVFDFATATQDQTLNFAATGGLTAQQSFGVGAGLGMQIIVGTGAAAGSSVTASWSHDNAAITYIHVAAAFKAEAAAVAAPSRIMRLFEGLRIHIVGSRLIIR